MSNSSDFIFWFDTETGSLDSRTGALLSISVLIEKNKNIIFRKTWNLKPYKNRIVTNDSLAINHIKREDIENKHIEFEVFINELLDLLNSYHITYNTRLSIGGKNVNFDYSFLYAHFIDYFESIGKDGKKVWYSFFRNRFFDPTYLLPIIEDVLELKLNSHKLSNIYKFFFKEDLEWHNSESDVIATVKLYHLFRNLFESSIRLKLNKPEKK